MAFEGLLNKPMLEQQLLELITQELQQDFSQHQETYYFLKLEKASPEKFVSIAWIKTFTDIHEWSDFYWDTKYQRACVMIKFVKDRYEVLYETNRSAQQRRQQSFGPCL